MAISLTIDKKRTRYSGSEKVIRGTGNLGTYATNGIAVAASDLGLNTLFALKISPSASGTVFTWDRANGKVKAFVSNGAAPAELAEVANAANIASRTFEFEANGV